MEAWNEKTAFEEGAALAAEEAKRPLLLEAHDRTLRPAQQAVV